MCQDVFQGQSLEHSERGRDSDSESLNGTSASTKHIKRPKNVPAIFRDEESSSAGPSAADNENDELVMEMSTVTPPADILVNYTITDIYPSTLLSIIRKRAGHCHSWWRYPQ